MMLIFVPFSVLECMLFKYFSRCLPFTVATASGSTVELAVQQGDANEPVLMGSKNAAGDEGTHAASAWFPPGCLRAGWVVRVPVATGFVATPLPCYTQ